MAHGGLDLEAIHKEINEPEEARKLFLGGLKNTTTEKHLYEAFMKYGHLVDVCVIRGPNYKPRGFGFVTFSKAVMMEAVLKDAPTLRFMVDGKLIELKRIVKREDMPKTGNSVDLPAADEDTCRIFIGGIPEITTREILEEFFEKFGEIDEIEIPLNIKHQKPRGFAFVTFASKEAVEKVVAIKYHYLKGKKVEVKKAIEREKLRRNPPPEEAMPEEDDFEKGDSMRKGGGGRIGKRGWKGNRDGGQQTGLGSIDRGPMGHGGMGMDPDEYGEVGHMGPPGTIGPPGTMGPPGVMGLNGGRHRGPVGPGNMGPMGPRGPMGPEGIGPRGRMGPEGMGARGPMGPEGMGARGPLGPRGRMGPEGMGLRGPLGLEGMGPRGLMGPRGSMLSRGSMEQENSMGRRGPMGADGMGPRGQMGSDGMGPRGQMVPEGSMGPGRYLGRGESIGPGGMGMERPMGGRGGSLGPDSRGKGGPRGPTRPGGPQNFGSMDKWDERMMDNMPSEEMLRRQFGDGAMDFGGFPPNFDSPDKFGPEQGEHGFLGSSRDFPMPGSVGSRVGGNFGMSASALVSSQGGMPREEDFGQGSGSASKDPEMSQSKMKEYYRTMYMWKYKWYQMMKAWHSAKAAASEGGRGSAGSSSGNIRPGYSGGTSQSTYSSLESSGVPWSQQTDSSKYRGPSQGGDGFGTSPSNYGRTPETFTGMGSNYGNNPSSFGPMKKMNFPDDAGRGIGSYSGRSQSYSSGVSSMGPQLM